MSFGLTNHLRTWAAAVRRPTGVASRLMTRFGRNLKFVLQLMVWSRLLASSRGPMPLHQSPRLRKAKGVDCPPPALHVIGPPALAEAWNDAFAACYTTLFLNLQNPDILSARRYAHPAPAFRGVYLWDSAFIAQVWRRWDAGVALDVLRAVLDLRDGDRLQHVVSDFMSSAYTQPPLIAWSFARMLDGPANRVPSPVQVREAYHVLNRYNAWLYEHRRLDNGLFFWAHAYESGMDNAPRFGPRDEYGLRDTTGWAAPDLCSYVILQHEALARMADRLDRADDAASHREQAEALREKTRAFLWDDDHGYFFDRELSTGHWIHSRSIASLIPLWAGVPTSDQADRLASRVMDEAMFNTPLPLPTVPADAPEYEPDMWRGPVWINTAYAVILGMERYGYRREAASLAWRLCDGVYRVFAERRRFYEYYDPHRHDIDRLSRKRGNRWKKWTLGSLPQSEFVGWTGLVNTLLLEQVLGLRWRGGRLTLRPCLPPEAAGLAFSLSLPGEDAGLQLHVLGDAGECRGAVRWAGHWRRFETRGDGSVQIEMPTDPAESDADAAYSS